MSDGKLFAKSNSVELHAELEQALKKSKSHSRVKIVLRKVIANIILNNNELAAMMTDIIDLFKLEDLEIRKMCFQYLSNYAHMNPRDASEALPYLEQFCNNSSPIVRALAIRTLASVANRDYIDQTVGAVKSGLTDVDAYVRKTAAYAVSRLYQHDPTKTEKHNLVSELNELLYDKNQVVVSNALASLSYITEHSKTLTLAIDRAHSMALITHLGNANEWCQIYILNSLMSYVPQNSEEALDLIEATIPSLQHENSSVVLNAIKVIVYYSHYVKNPGLIFPTLPKRLGSSLISLLSKPAEIQFLVLRNVILLLLGSKDLVSFDVEMFFCHNEDPIYIKDTKLEIIYLLADEQKVHVVLRELEEYASEVDVSMARKAIRALGNLAVKLPNAADACVEVIRNLFKEGISYIVQESAIVLKNIIRKYPNKFQQETLDLVKFYKLIDEPDAKASMIWIIGQTCQFIDEVDTIFEVIVSNFKDDPIEVQYAALTAATKLYLILPEKGEQIVLNILKWATEESDNPDIRDRGYIYWRLISSEYANGRSGNFQEVTKEIILNPNPIISPENDSIDPKILEELELNIGTLASIYLKPVSHVFRLAKVKFLPISPVLQKREQTSKPVASNGIPATKSVHSTSAKKTSSLSSQVADTSIPARNLTPRSTSSKQTYDSAGSSNEDISLKNSFAKRLTRKATQLAGRKGSRD